MKPILPFILATATAAVLLFASSGALSRPALAVPANDNLAQAIAVTTPSPSGIVATASTTGATTEGGEQTSLSGCTGTVAAPATGNTVWYTWTAPGSAGTVVFDTFGSDFNTTLAVYTGSAFPLTLVACNDNQAAASGAPAALALTYTAGQTYRIQAGGSGGGTGNLVLSMSTGAQIVVNHATDDNTADANLNLREATLLAVGGVGAGGLNRALTAGEAQLVLNGPGGSASSDLVHFSATLTLNPNTNYPALSGAAPDHISGIGVSPVINGPFTGSCLTLESNGNAVSGLHFQFCNIGVWISGNNNRVGGTLTALERNVFLSGNQAVYMNGSAAFNSVVGNYMGTDSTGNACSGPLHGILLVDGAHDNMIGGSTPAHRNVISCYTNGNAVHFWGVANNSVRGNYIGTNAAGTAALGNSNGILINSGASNNSIGGTTAGERNVISGNTTGVSISGSGTAGNIVRGNYIGTNAAGAAAVANAFGVVVSGGATNNTVGPSSDLFFLPNERNLISGNQSGVEISGFGTTGNIVRGNQIGLSAAGTAAVPNGDGVRILSDASGNTIGAAQADRQVISGNGIGIWLNSPSNQIIGNYIGTDPAGNAAIGNDSGILISDVGGNTIGGTTSGRRNVISGNTQDGINIGYGDAIGNVVYGNYIGTDATGNADLGNVQEGIDIHSGANNNVIGGSGAGQRNVISGNGGSGIELAGIVASTSSNIVRGNYVGTDAAGTAAIANNVGIRVYDAHNNAIGGSGAGEGNVVSGNSWGITLSAASSGNTILGNRVGTTPSGISPLPNANNGISIDFSPSNTTGDVAGGANVIAFNGGIGVAVSGPDGVNNPIRGNSIYSNAGIGIDNFAGGNGELAPPVISGINASGGVFGIACSGCLVDLYTDSANEGRFYHGAAFADASGYFSGFVSPIGANLTATATYNNNTSEFSAPFAVAEPCDGADNDGDTLVDEGNPNTDGDGQANCVDPDDDNDNVFDSSDSCPLVAEDLDAFEDADGCPEQDNDHDGFCDPGQSAAGCTGSDSGQMCFDPAGTLSCPTFDCRNIGEDVDAFKDTDGCPEPDNDNDGFPDGKDVCAGTNAHAGPDGMLGSPQDLNHNGIKDPSESPLSTDDVVLTFEDYDTVLNGDGCHDSPGQDFDADGYTDDTEEGGILCNGANSDVFDDTVADDGCPGGPTQVGAFSEAQFRTGTKAFDPCGQDAWPSDLVSTGISANKFDTVDLASFVAPVRRMDKNPGETGFDSRWDLTPGNSGFGKFINIADLAATVSGAKGFPPMLGGQKALNKTCPVAP